eukprot:Colp12_sorted_trinity150504_noHs@35528
MGKKINANPKAVEARERKEEAKSAAKAKAEKDKEDKEWEVNDKDVISKQKRKEDEEKKKMEALKRKQEAKALLEAEEAANSKVSAKAKPAPKITRQQIQINHEIENKERERLEKQAAKEKAKEEAIIPENTNRMVDEFIGDDGLYARTVEEAIAGLSTQDAGLDKHPERRMKATYKAYEEKWTPLLKEENPSLKLSQIRQLIKKQWQKAPENPMNQAHASFNS